MKLTILFCSILLLSLSVFAMAEQASAPTQPDCSMYEDGVCSREFDPVCGSDGQTYSTECVLCQNNKSKNKSTQVMHRGMCKA